MRREREKVMKILQKSCFCFSSQRFVFHLVKLDMTGFFKKSLFVKEKNLKNVSRIFENEFKKSYHNHVLKNSLADWASIWHWKFPSRFLYKKQKVCYISIDKDWSAFQRIKVYQSLEKIFEGELLLWLKEKSLHQQLCLMCWKHGVWTLSTVSHQELLALSWML